jgi:adenylosuccinate synthase
LDSLAVTKLDVLDRQKVIKICTGYKIGKFVHKHFPANIEMLNDCEAVYEEWPGWESPTTGAKRLEDLPQNAQKYLRRLEELMEIPIEIVSVGAERDETIFVNKSLAPA